MMTVDLIIQKTREPSSEFLYHKAGQRVSQYAIWKQYP